MNKLLQLRTSGLFCEDELTLILVHLSLNIVKVNYFT